MLNMLFRLGLSVGGFFVAAKPFKKDWRQLLAEGDSLGAYLELTGAGVTQERLDDPRWRQWLKDGRGLDANLFLTMGIEPKETK